VTIYFMLRGYGFLWQVWEYNPMTALRVVCSLRFYWRDRLNPKREWSVQITDDRGLMYTEHSWWRTGSWCLRGPWAKVA
jgi:hypothetical protein